MPTRLLPFLFLALAACGRAELLICESGDTRACSDPCGTGAQTCEANQWRACVVPVATATCTNQCGTGQKTCSNEVWSDCVVAQTTQSCTNLCGTGAQTCNDDVWSDCVVAPQSIACSSACGAGTIQCANNTMGTCNAPPTLPPSITATVRDFLSGNPPDFEHEPQTSGSVLDLGIVLDSLGADGTPQYGNWPSGTPTTTGAADFYDWYHDVPGINMTTTVTIPLAQSTANTELYNYDNEAFFPIDNELLGNQGRAHNGDFTLQASWQFTYKGGEVFTLASDDDSWLFINGRLAIDLGGIHNAISGSVDLDQQASTLEIATGNTYSIALFYAERHVTGAILRMSVAINNWKLCN